MFFCIFFAKTCYIVVKYGRDMLIQFTIDNYRSIKNTLTFSMVSGRKNKEFCFEERNLRLLPSAVLYGANASGKSNILMAFRFMRSMVLNSHKVVQSTDTLLHDPFRLSSETEVASSSFEAVFLQKGVKYRYGFEADATTVYSEWLFADTNGKEAKLFFRDAKDDEFYVNPEKFKEGKGLKVLPNSLFIWKCDQEGGSVSREILDWFKKVKYLDGMKSSKYLTYTFNKMYDADFRAEIVKLVKSADLGIQDINVEKSEVPASAVIDGLPLPDNVKEAIKSSASPLTEIGIKTVHGKTDASGHVSGTSEFDLQSMESKGTQKFFCLSAPFLETLRNGGVLIVDELDASLHPMLTMALVSLFAQRSLNKNNAQLIFATHDTNLLRMSMFDRSQIWFVEKDLVEGTHVASLSEYKNVRATADIGKMYIQGKFGAVPYVGDFFKEEE